MCSNGGGYSPPASVVASLGSYGFVWFHICSYVGIPSPASVVVPMGSFVFLLVSMGSYIYIYIHIYIYIRFLQVPVDSCGFPWFLCVPLCSFGFLSVWIPLRVPGWGSQFGIRCPIPTKRCLGSMRRCYILHDSRSTLLRPDLLAVLVSFVL